MAALKLFGLLFIVFTNISVVFSAEICGKTDNFPFDIDVLYLGRPWTLDLKDKYSCQGEKNAIDGCRLNISFCQPLDKPCGSFKDSSVCMESYKNKTSVVGQFSLATYTKDKNQFATSNKGSFDATFLPGQNVSHSNKTKILTITLRFSCQPKMVWSNPINSTSPIPKDAVREVKNTTDDTYYNYTVSLDYSGACLPAPPPPTDNSSSLSAGTILIIIFFITISVYFITGCFINGARGYTGRKILPQSDFWTSLPEYIFDGCMFTCRCGTPDTDGVKYDRI